MKTFSYLQNYCTIHLPNILIISTSESWRQCVPPEHREISATATRHQNWGEKIQTGGKFWWKETLQLKPSLKTALIWQHLTWVVFPDPVSPQISTTWLLLIKLTMSSLIDQMGKACLNGSNSWFTVACGTCGMPPFIRPTALFMSFTVKSKLQYASLNDRNTFWKMCRWAISSLCERVLT